MFLSHLGSRVQPKGLTPEIVRLQLLQIFFLLISSFDFNWFELLHWCK